MQNNYWTNLSIEYANQRNYLDKLFSVYPTIPNDIREINKDLWGAVERSFQKRDNSSLIKNLLKLELFPIKDSYISYLRKDEGAITRNPETINRICGSLFEMGLDVIFEKTSQPKETNRQIGPLFKRWLEKGELGIQPISIDNFNNNNNNAILSGGDSILAEFARDKLSYKGDKGIDLVARFNGKYIIGEAKFLTDFGGHQNAQFNDAMTLLDTKVSAIKIAILDGVLYIPNNAKMHNIIKNSNKNIMSSLVLREFLYQV